MKLLVINGPNLNLLGIREPEQYGRRTYAELTALIRDVCRAKAIDVECVQSNHEGVLVDEIQRAYFEKFDGIVINPAAYTHTSIALLDAIKAVSLPVVEVHISNVEAREAFRQVSFLREACIGTVSGLGFEGYIRAIELLEAKQCKA